MGFDLNNVNIWGVHEECTKKLTTLCKEHKEHNLHLTEVQGRGQKRKYVGIEGISRIVVAFSTRPRPSRVYNDRAWNRISKIDKINLKDLHGANYKDKDTGTEKPIKCLVIQIWERDNSRVFVIIPLDTLLEKTPIFTRTGDFTVKEESHNFYLVTPQGENNIRLRTGIDRILDYL